MKEIEKLIPHRSPFLFIDEIIDANTETIKAQRQFTMNDSFFTGHFPQYPVVPGVLLVEAMAQAGGAGVRKIGILNDDTLFFLASVDKVKFRHQVRPDDTVTFMIENKRISDKMLKQAGKAYIGKTLVVEAEWMCIVGKIQVSS